MVKELSMISLFETFIKDSFNGKRRKVNGERIKPQTVDNYKYVLKLLIEYETYTGHQLVIRRNIGNAERVILREKKYWKQFYNKFSDFLFYKKHYFDNYVGFVFKNVKCFFRYLRNEKFLAIKEFYESFYVRREEIRIIALLPERFCFLIMNKDFEEGLNDKLRCCKDLFVFGCTTASRFSDLTNLKVRDIEIHGKDYFLYYRSLKTDTPVNVKLPVFAIAIYLKYAENKDPRETLFPPICLDWFNECIRTICRKASWTEPIGKFRNRDGKTIETVTGNKCLCSFCDLVSSHVMRRTGITVLLMMGMPEYLVRKISGHAAQSKSFFRYVNFAQSYITDEIDKVYSKLKDLYAKTAVTR